MYKAVLVTECESEIEALSAFANALNDLLKEWTTVDIEHMMPFTDVRPDCQTVINHGINAMVRLTGERIV